MKAIDLTIMNHWADANDVCTVVVLQQDSWDRENKMEKWRGWYSMDKGVKG